MSEQGTFEVPAQVNADQAMLSLMAMAESFRNGKPHRYKMAIKCVMVNILSGIALLVNKGSNF